MLYGYRKEKVTVVTASHGNTQILVDWAKALPEADSTFLSKRETEFSDAFEVEFKRLRHDVFIFEHADADQQEKFINEKGITVLNPQTAWDRHDTMVEFDVPDFYDVSETRTLEQIEGLTENDPWDRRTDEQKAEDQKMKDMIEEMKKSGEISSDGSFTPRKPKEGDDNTAHVTDIRTSVGADGKVSIDNVLARKDYSDLKGDAQREADKEHGKSAS
jgi:hypothetical protein